MGPPGSLKQNLFLSLTGKERAQDEPDLRSWWEQCMGTLEPAPPTVLRYEPIGNMGFTAGRQPKNQPSRFACKGSGVRVSSSPPIGKRLIRLGIERFSFKNPATSLAPKELNIAAHKLKSLSRAKEMSNSIVFLQSDYGSVIHLVVPAVQIECDREDLKSLLEDLVEAMEPGSQRGASKTFHAGIFSKQLAIGSEVDGGRNGAVVVDGIWVLGWLERAGLKDSIRAVLAGNIRRIPRERIEAAQAYRDTELPP